MDISDILRELNAPHLNRDPFASSSPSNGLHPGQADLQALTRAWINERGATELLPYVQNDFHTFTTTTANLMCQNSWPKDNLIERVTGLIKSQISLVEELTGDMDPKTNFSLIIIQTEVERWKFIVRSLLRARIAKIDKHPLFYLRENGGTADRMGEQERLYAERHQMLLEGHYNASFMGAFPETLRGLEDKVGSVHMVEGPDLEGAVFGRGLVGGEGDEEDGEGEGTRIRVRGRDGDGVASVGRGEVIVARWADVRGAVERGDMELV